MKTLCIPLILILSTSLVGQIEFAPIGARWIINEAYSIEDGEKPLEAFKVLESLSDTLIENLSFRNVSGQLFHQDENKVYYLYNDTLRLLYDFGVTVGDTTDFEVFNCSNGIDTIKFLITEVDSILFGEIFLKTFQCEVIEGWLLNGETSYTYSEMIGSHRIPIEDLAGCITIPGYISDRLRCYDFEGKIFKTDWFSQFGDVDCEIITSTENLVYNNSLTIYPNPADETLNISSENIEIKYLKIITAGGSQIKEYNYHKNRIIDVSEYESGLYFAVLFDSDMRLLETLKFVVR